MDEFYQKMELFLPLKNLVTVEKRKTTIQTKYMSISCN